MITILTNETIIDFLKENPGISREVLISKFKDECSIEEQSVQAHLYSLKEKHFLRNNDGKLYYTNPFTEIYKELYDSEENHLHLHVRNLNARILEMVQLMAPSVYKRIEDLTNEAKNEAF